MFFMYSNKYYICFCQSIFMMSDIYYMRKKFRSKFRIFVFYDYMIVIFNKSNGQRFSKIFIFNYIDGDFFCIFDVIYVVR